MAAWEDPRMFGNEEGKPFNYSPNLWHKYDIDAAISHATACLQRLIVCIIKGK